MYIIIITIFAFGLVLTGWLFYYCRRHFSGMLDIVTRLTDTTAKMANDIADTQGEVDRTSLRINTMANDIAELKAEFDELPAEAISNVVEAQKCWNDGLQSIINYGQDIAKLNKEGIKRG